MTDILYVEDGYSVKGLIEAFRLGEASISTNAGILAEPLRIKSAELTAANTTAGLTSEALRIKSAASSM